MTYTVKSIFGPTIQGEGGMTGVPCLFVRLAGCNMWDGRPETRPQSQCPFCDTDFFKGERMTDVAIVNRCNTLTDGIRGFKWVTISGGEPMLQLKKGNLVSTLQNAGFRVAIETNGTVPIPEDIHADHITCSPKVVPGQLEINANQIDSLKVLYPHPNPLMRDPEQFARWYDGPGERWLQPIEDENWTVNTQAAVDYVTKHPWWRLSTQVHKYIGVE